MLKDKHFLSSYFMLRIKENGVLLFNNKPKKKYHFYIIDLLRELLEMRANPSFQKIQFFFMFWIVLMC